MKISTAIITILFGPWLAGCSVYSAATRPDYTDTSFIAAGVSRSDLVSKLGQPCRTYSKDNARIDVFEQSDAGLPSGQKALRATGYALFDAVTFGVGEFWGSELETDIKRECTTYSVTYGPDEIAKSVDIRHWNVEQPPSAAAQRAGYCGVDYHAPACVADQKQ